MGDCCSDLKAEIAALRSQIQNLHLDEGAVAKRVESSLIPKLPGFINPIVITNINPFKLRLGAVESASQTALSNARASLERSYQASNAASSASAAAGTAKASALQALGRLAAIAATLAALAASVATLLVLGRRIDSVDKRLDIMERDMSKTLSLLFPIKSAALKAQDTANQADKTAERALRDAKSAEAKGVSAQNGANRAAKTANDALYETRQGRKILEGKIGEAYKLANDSLYETREGRKKLEGQIYDTRKLANEALYETRAGRAKLEDQILQAYKLGNEALYETRAGRGILQSGIDKAYKVGNEGLYEARGTRGVAESAKGFALTATDTARNAQSTANQALTRALIPGRNGVDGKNGADGKAGRDGVDGKNGRDGRDGIQGIPGIQGFAGVPGAQGLSGRNGIDGKPGKDGIDGKNGRDGKNGKDAPVDNESKSLLGEISAKLSAIPPLIIAKPDPLNFDQTVKAAQTGVCNTTQPGGCMNKALNDASNGINNNGNANTGKLLDAINAGANTAQLGLLNTINTKLGAQIPGGIGGFLSNFFTRFEEFSKWTHLDRVLNLLTWWQTLHNAYMLSNNLGQTLTSAVSNVLAAIGIKDAQGNPLDINNIIGKAFDDAAKTAMGVSTWEGIKSEWKRYNRIYQAAANIVNSIQSIGWSILSALETVGSWVALIGNALRKWGEVGEKAFGWMNTTPNFHNKYFTALQDAENFVSQIDSVASETLSIQDTVKQLTTQKDDLQKALSQSPGAKQSTVPPEPATIKTQETQIKSASATGLAIRDEDLIPDED